MLTKIDHKSETIDIPEGFVAVGVIGGDDTHVIVLLQQARPIELVGDGKLVIQSAAIVDPQHLLVSYTQEVEISEAQSWRDKYPEELADLDDKAVMEKVPLIQEANEAIEKYGQLSGQFMAGLTVEEILLQRDELDRQQAEADAHDAVVAAQKAESEASILAFQKELADNGLTLKELISKLK